MYVCMYVLNSLVYKDEMRLKLRIYLSTIKDGIMIYSMHEPISISDGHFDTYFVLIFSSDLRFWIKKVKVWAGKLNHTYIFLALY